MVAECFCTVYKCIKSFYSIQEIFFVNINDIYFFFQETCFTEPGYCGIRTFKCCRDSQYIIETEHGIASQTRKISKSNNDTTKLRRPFRITHFAFQGGDPEAN